GVGTVVVLVQDEELGSVVEGCRSNLIAGGSYRHDPPDFDGMLGHLHDVRESEAAVEIRDAAQDEQSLLPLASECDAVLHQRARDPSPTVSGVGYDAADVAAAERRPIHEESALVVLVTAQEGVAGERTAQVDRLEAWYTLDEAAPADRQ